MRLVHSNQDAPREVIGAKAANLVRLSKLGVNVPPFFCVPADAFQFSATQVLALVDFEDENSIQMASEKILEDMARAFPSDGFDSELRAYLNEDFAGTTLFSVRSSALTEDSQSHTFAGQFDTYLNVSRSDLAGMILRCFRSLYSPSALKYAHVCGVEFSHYTMSVIVQKMIVSDTAGVIFTSNPQGLLNEAVVINGRGAGNLVVADKTPVTTYYYNKTDKNYYYESDEDAPILSNAVVERLMDTAFDVEEALGESDIEYVISDDDIYVLQSRPITTMSEGRRTVLDSSNIVESYPGITLPLTYSFIQEAYEGVFKNAVFIITKNSKLIDDHTYVFKNMLGSVNGRVYYKISNWYTLIHCLPFSKRIVPIWQEMMGVRDTSLTDTDVRISFPQKVRTYANSFFALFHTTRSMRRLEEDFDSVNTWFYEAHDENLSNEELRDLYGELRERILNKWGITLINDMYAFLFTGLLTNVLETSSEADANDYISGISDIDSMKPVEELIRITNVVISQDKCGELTALRDEEDVRAFLNEEGVIQNEINNYVHVFGDRCLEELKLESKTFRTSPLLLIHKIIEYANDRRNLDKITRVFEKRATAGSLVEGLGLIKRKYVGFLGRRAITGIKNREISRLNRSRIYGMTRTIFVSIARHFQQRGLIDDVEDVFYLTVDEVFHCVESSDIDVKGIIRDRKREFELYKQLPFYSRLVFDGSEWSKKHRNVNSVPVERDCDEITGTPCSSGVVTGEVVLINDPKDAENVTGKILVTKITDPGWVFLLTVAKGVIAEKGSLLSHTAIISRELKVPAIVGVAHATALLRTGDIVRMDGGSGIIERVSN